MPYVDANGVHTYYETHGEGPPLLLLHGAFMVAEGWKPQIEALSPLYTLYVPERRGVGRTADIAGRWTYFEMANDTAAFMDALGIESAPIVGFSDGGNIALILAFQRPDLVSKLVVTGANASSSGLGEFGEAVARMSGSELLEAAPPQVLPWLALHRRVSPDKGASLAGLAEKMIDMWLNYEITPEELESVSAPSLIMAGDEDVISVDHTVEYWSRIPGARLCIAPQAGHFWLHEKPDLFNGLVVGFLSD